ncbi:MAG: transglutaminase-like domain-containing protein, partial [Lachnospiraceae bacterium]|nr:transglutaminase-like domain-containing protein [Lachnospiraceae bacterium]
TRVIDITTQNKSMKTALMFAPSKVLPDSVIPGSEYRLTYLRLNPRAEGYTGMLYDPPQILKKYWDEALMECRVTDTAAYSYDHYEGYRNDLYDTYLPVTQLSDRAKAFMAEALEGADSDYEKLKRIEALLSSGRYTDSPGMLPEDIDSPERFVDYFLFERFEGYCSYYATAFVLLSRYCGIPSRYVQGYRVLTDDEIRIEVHSTDAHAWAESYIDGVGWVTFEPTPGYIVTSASGWLTFAEKEELMKGYVSGARDVSETNTGDEDGMLLDTTEEDKPAFPWKRVLIPVIIGAVFTALLILADNLIKKHRYGVMDIRQKVLWQCARNMSMLKRKGYGRKDSETLSEYGYRLEGLLSTDYPAFIPVYERMLYSDLIPNEDELIMLEGSFDILKTSVRSAGRKRRAEFAKQLVSAYNRRH